MINRNDLEKSDMQILNEYPLLWETLLLDRTTKKNIIWATKDYKYLGTQYGAENHINFNMISHENANLIKNRRSKPRESQNIRTKRMAEVSTPTWLCNIQNNLIDEAWFKRKDVFNTSIDKSWKVVKQKIVFPDVQDRKWEDYINERRLEVACGEGPYLVSLYNSHSGQKIDLEERIGLLDRKMRIVGENTETEAEWLQWSEKAYQSIYGFEFQGDSLFLARKNLLLSYVSYCRRNIKRIPTYKELLNIATIISWNLWQMDGLEQTVPYHYAKRNNRQLSLFEEEPAQSLYCNIKNWDTMKTIEFKDLIEGDANIGR